MPYRQWARQSKQFAARAMSAAHLHNLPGGARGAGDRATYADLLACYRLLLKRPPDAEGLATYRRRLREGISAGQLADEFVGSVEFTRAHNHARRPERAASEVVGTSEGFRMHVDPSDFAVGHTVARTGVYEPHVSSALRKVLSRGQTFVDVGANIGWFSLLAAGIVGPAGTVLAIEPNPWNVALLRESAKENGFDNIEVAEVALAAVAGAAALETDGSNGRLIPVDGPPSQPIEASFVVATLPLDDLLANEGVERVDAIKVDVEGAEPLVLEGAVKTIERDRPVLLSEFYPLALDCAPWGSACGYLSTLRRLGYHLSVIGADDVAPRGLDDYAILSMVDDGGHVDLLAVPD